MRLTNHLRDCFIRAVGNDIPEVKAPTFNEIYEAIQSEWTISQKAAYEAKEVQNRIKTDWVNAPKSSNGRYVITFGVDYEKLPIYAEWKKAEAARDNVLADLRRVANACTTLKALQERLPDLKKYMADEEKKATPGVPVPTGLMDKLKSVGFKGAK